MCIVFVCVDVEVVGFVDGGAGAGACGCFGVGGVEEGLERVGVVDCGCGGADWWCTLG